MPYSSTKDLSESVKSHLPEHAQSIYLQAFNNSLHQYHNRKKRRNKDDNSEVIAHKVAWAAVKKKYKKAIDSDWIEK